MGRLIDANRFKRFLQALCKAGAPYYDVIQLLDKQPTAYDVEKVVEELGTRQDDIQVDVSLHDFYIQGYSSAIDYANDIVIKGGVE